MRPVIAISITSPYVTLEKWLEMSGMKEQTARDMIKQNRIPTKPTPKGKTRSLVEINVAAMTVEALKGYDVHLDA